MSNRVARWIENKLAERYMRKVDAENARRRERWTGFPIAECEGCGYVVPDCLLKAVSMNDGSDQLECEDCRGMRAFASEYMTERGPR
jgi:hypothetical protein